MALKVRCACHTRVRGRVSSMSSQSARKQLTKADRNVPPCCWLYSHATEYVVLHFSFNYVASYLSKQTYNFQRGKCEAEQAAVTECADRKVLLCIPSLPQQIPTLTFSFFQVSAVKKQDTMRYHLVRLLNRIRR